jgi:hypothetical protein
LFQDLSKLGSVSAFSGEPTSANPLAGSPAGTRLAQAGGGPSSQTGPAAAVGESQPNPLAPVPAPQGKPFVPWAFDPETDAYEA